VPTTANDFGFFQAQSGKTAPDWPTLLGCWPSGSREPLIDNNGENLPNL